MRTFRQIVIVLCTVALCVGVTLFVGPVSAAVVLEDDSQHKGAASEKPLPFEVDVWTNHGGEGPGGDGGDYSSSDEVVVYLESTWDCYASISVGPLGGEPSMLMDAQLEAGERYQLAPRETGADLVGTWQVSINAVSGAAYASDTVVFTVGDAALPESLAVDVWTDQRGRGIGLPGGSYLLGESTTIWIEVGADSDVTWRLSGPGGSGSDTVRLPAGTYAMQLGQAEADDVGVWLVEVEVRGAGQMASDTVRFVVLPIQSATQGQAVQPAGLQPRSNAPAATVITPDNATELDALLAVKMAKGMLLPSPSLDVNGDGQVTLDDARLILQWSVQ
ncbi:MAG: hypothetical protein JW846_03860 [Dehalococcoidia bacterium]|nr:hypothetical protein [Dehalococcoidia bacterium]